MFSISRATKRCSDSNLTQWDNVKFYYFKHLRNMPLTGGQETSWEHSLHYIMPMENSFFFKLYSREKKYIKMQKSYRNHVGMMTAQYIKPVCNKSYYVRTVEAYSGNISWTTSCWNEFNHNLIYFVNCQAWRPLGACLSYNPTLIFVYCIQ